MSTRADVLILGSGPSAAFAILACQRVGVRFDVLSTSVPRTEQAGAFFLHWLPEGMAEPVRVFLGGIGTREGYLEKQWRRSDIPSSFPEEANVQLWYNSVHLGKVWAEVKVELTSELNSTEVYHFGDDYAWVFHTFPVAEHSEGRELALFPTLTELGLDYASNTIIYNGILSDPHVRSTVAMGRYSVEFPRHTRQEVLAEYKQFFRGRQTLVHLRDIPPDTPPVTPSEWLKPNVVPLGRFAQWDRRLLSHHSYSTVMQVLTGVAV